MKRINNIVVTFWYNKVPDIKTNIQIFEDNLNEFFHGISAIGIPANIDPIVPRLTAVSDGGHSKLEVSMINLKLETDFDENFNNDYEKCFDYIEQRALKIYEILSEKINLKILYGAVLATCEIEEPKPVNLIKERLFSNKLNGNYCEVGLRAAEILENKFYRTITINSAKQITFTKKVENTEEIILPLISLTNSTIDKESVIINSEINDKYSFDSISDYSLCKDEFKEMLNILKRDINEEINKIIYE